MTKKKWEVLSCVGNSTEPQSIKRSRDNAVFSLQDYVTNGTRMKGHILKFEYNFKDDSVFVMTDWSCVGMNLDSLSQAIKLPSQHQIGHFVVLDFGEVGKILNCEINKVHFAEGKVLYDVVIHLNGKRGIVGPTTRLYNVDSVFVIKP